MFFFFLCSENKPSKVKNSLKHIAQINRPITQFFDSGIQKSVQQMYVEHSCRVRKYASD